MFYFKFDFFFEGIECGDCLEVFEEGRDDLLRMVELEDVGSFKDGVFN